MIGFTGGGGRGLETAGQLDIFITIMVTVTANFSPYTRLLL